MTPRPLSVSRFWIFDDRCPRTIRMSLRRRSARIVFDKWLSHRALVHDYEPLVAGGHPLELLLFVTRINGEAVVL
jgi:hypothetical protein